MTPEREASLGGRGAADCGEGGQRLDPDGPQPDEAMRAMPWPLGRLIDPTEVAGMYMLLASGPGWSID